MAHRKNLCKCCGVPSSACGEATTGKFCLWCQDPIFVGLSVKAKFCSIACEQDAHFERELIDDMMRWEMSHDEPDDLALDAFAADAREYPLDPLDDFDHVEALFY